MSFYDVLMLAIFGLTILFGLWKGLAWQIASMAAIIVSYIVAMQFRGEVSGYIQAAEPWNKFAAMLILYVGTSIVVWIIYGFFVRKTIDGLRLRWFDRPAGALAGAVKGAIVCMVVTIFAVTLLGTNARDAIMASKSGAYIAAAINRLDKIMPNEIHAYLNQYINDFNNKMTEKNPDWIRESEEKFNGKIKQFKGDLRTFHGQWNGHSNSQKNRAGGNTPPRQTLDKPPANRAGGFTSDNNRTGNQIQQSMKNSFNDIQDRLNPGMIQTGLNSIEKTADQWFTPNDNRK